MRRWLAACAGLVVALAPYAPARAAEPLRLTVGTVGSIGALDPRTGTSDVAREVWDLQYPTLTTLDPKTLDPAPGLAVAWSPTPNGQSWVYTLRPDRMWSDGKPVTAGDVVASVEQAGGDARAVSDREIEIFNLVPGALVNVAPQHVLEAVPDLDKNLSALGVAAGQWHVTARTEDSVQLDARSDAPALRQIVFRTYPSADSLIAALDRGEVDVVSGLPYSDAERLGALPGVTVNHAPGDTQFVLRINVSDPRFREAISLAIDRTDLVAKTVDGIGTPGVVPIFGRGEAWRLDDATTARLESSLDAQPGRARALLADVPRADRALTLAAPRDATSQRVAKYLVDALAAVDVNVQVVGHQTNDDLVLAGGAPPLANHTPARSYQDLLNRAHAQARRDTEMVFGVGLFQPDTLQAFRSDNVTGWLRSPQIRSLVVFAPTITQYSQLLAAPPPPGEEASTATYVVGAIGVLALCAAAFAGAAWIRRRSIA